MERGRPEFEDEKIRRWRADDPSERLDDDPTVLRIVDSAREEFYESRVYDLNPQAPALLIPGLARDNPDLTPEEILRVYVEDSPTISFRILAKRAKDHGLVTFLLVARFGDMRYLLADEALVPAERYHEFVSEFEERALGTGLVGNPTVIDLEQWRAYDADMGEPQ